MSDLIFGGVEGGGTHSKVILVDGTGKILCKDEYGFSTSHWLVGMETCQSRLYEMVQKAKAKSGLPLNVPLKGLGLSLSGCEQVETNEEIKKGLKEKYPDLSENYDVVSDTVGSVVTVNPSGGIVLISGTGSNSLLLNPDGSTNRCGGWGWLLGDEGSAYWLGHKAAKRIIDDEDNFCEHTHDTNVLREIVLDHFQIKDRFGLLDHAYTKFDKAFLADVTRKIAEGASQQKDPLCMELFRDAGFQLGRHLRALSKAIHPDLLNQEGGLHVACVGQMWKSWELLKKGFLEGLTTKNGELCLPEFTLLSLRTSLALGAAYLGAKVAGHVLPMDSASNASAFYHHSSETREIGPMVNGDGPNSVYLKKSKENSSDTALIRG